jgi:hypothetical protein
MSDLPFIADARYPRGYPQLDEGKWFQWRSVAMIELSALDTYQFVKSMLPHSAQTILEVGCGNGYLSLEMVIPSSESICQQTSSRWQSGARPLILSLLGLGASAISTQT